MPDEILGVLPARAPERHLRRLLALRVAIPGTYYDDGEASGREHGISIDFMREPVGDIEAKLQALYLARAACVPPKCCVCETTEGLHKDGWYGYRCGSVNCMVF